MKERLVVVSVVRDKAMYATCVGDNKFLADAERVMIDNSIENRAIPFRYNAFLKDFDYSKPAWIMFCHEDFEVKDDIAKRLDELDCGLLYGFVGSRRIGLFGLGVQRILWGNKVKTGTEVETFDCCCIIVHSSLIQKHRLGFDEKLEFDLYVEDFCAMAKVKAGIRCRLLHFNAEHHSSSRATERLFRHLPYLKLKYPHNCFSATCVYFGTRPLLMRFEDWVIRGVFRKQ